MTNTDPPQDPRQGPVDPTAKEPEAGQSESQPQATESPLEAQTEAFQFQGPEAQASQTRAPGASTLGGQTPPLGADGPGAPSAGPHQANHAHAAGPPNQAQPQTQTQQQPYAPQPPPPVNRLYRSEDGPLAGVATGIANHFGFDPVFAQVAFVVLTIFGGSGALLYLAIWFLAPKAGSARSHASPTRRGVLPVVIGSLLLITAFGTLFAGPGFGFAFGPGHFFWFLILGLGVYLLMQRPDEVAAVGSSLRDLIPNPAAAQSITPSYGYATAPAPPSSGQTPAAAPWAIPQTGPGAAANAADPSPQIAKEPKPKSPPITSITLAIAAVGVGVLGALDQISGVSIEPKAMFGLVLGACGLGLLYASIRGRAWALLPIGLIAATLIPLQAVGDISYSYSFGEREYRVSSQDELDDTYRLSAGELVLNLGELDLQSDDKVVVKLIAGELSVIVPEGLSVDIRASSDYGEVNIFGHTVSGTDVELHELHPAEELTSSAEQPTSTQPVLTIIAETTFGEVRIEHDR